MGRSRTKSELRLIYRFKVSRLGYGCVGLTGVYNNPLLVEEGIKVLKEVYNRGITFFDTANIYGADHANEILIGKVLKELPREKIQLATKFGFSKFDPTKITVKVTPEYARSCCEGSLKRLGVDYIDLCYIYRIDMTVPIKDTAYFSANATAQASWKSSPRGKMKLAALSHPSLQHL